jgi:hypothetical protein
VTHPAEPAVTPATSAVSTAMRRLMAAQLAMLFGSADTRRQARRLIDGDLRLGLPRLLQMRREGRALMSLARRLAAGNMAVVKAEGSR